MSLREIWDASFAPKLDTTTRSIKGTVERCGPFNQGEFCFGFIYLLQGQAQPFRHQSLGSAGFPELTQPGDEVSLTLNASDWVLDFTNHTLAERLSLAASADPAVPAA